jgi:ribosome-associated protein
MTEPVVEPDLTLATAVGALAERRAERLIVLDLREKSSFTDFFVICHGSSERQVKSLTEEVVEKVRQATGRRPIIEGFTVADWVLLDYGDFLVHVFSAAARDFYRLESLWGDADRIDPRALAAGDASAR